MLHGEKFVDEYIVSLGSPPLSVAAITRTEVLIGAQKEQVSLKELVEYLNLFDCLAITKEVSDSAAKLYLSHTFPLKFKDLLIAATAIVHNMVLVTADKDFRKLEGLRVEVIEK